MQETLTSKSAYQGYNMQGVYEADCIKFMHEMIDEQSIDLTVTSPPYDQMRIYGNHRTDLYDVLNGLYHVTKKGGVLIWQVGAQHKDNYVY